MRTKQNGLMTRTAPAACPGCGSAAGVTHSKTCTPMRLARAVRTLLEELAPLPSKERARWVGELARTLPMRPREFKKYLRRVGIVGTIAREDGTDAAQ